MEKTLKQKLNKFLSLVWIGLVLAATIVMIILCAGIQNAEIEKQYRRGIPFEQIRVEYSAPEGYGTSR